MSAQAFVVSGGATPESVASARLPNWSDPLVIAADGGYRAACALGYGVTAVVGDLDSILPDDLDAIDRSITDVVVFAPDKDATDLELAIDEAISRGATEVCVIDSMQGRVDHFIASTLLLCSEKFAAIAMTARIGPTRVWVASAQRDCLVEAQVGATISIVAIGDVGGVSTRGLHYALNKENLRGGSSLGVSNFCVTSPFCVTVSTGTVVVIDEGIV